MTRDYKNPVKSRAPTARKQTLRSVWVWFVAGIVVGALGCWGFLTQGIDGSRIQAGVAAMFADQHSQTPPAAARPEPPETRFEFYTMLPEMEVAVPEQELRSEPAAEAQAIAPSASDAAYLLQVGSFRHREDADRLKASLALLGLEASLQTVTINGEETWHRVRVGPYPDVKTLNEARQRLRENQYEPMVLKIRR